MKLKLALPLIAALALAASAQTVTITPKKVSYERPHPRMGFKKSFTVTYPKVKAATPALSAKIERAVSYESVLDLRLSDEITKNQWLEEANYEVKYNKNGILCLNLWMEGTAAYVSESHRIVVVDTRTGVRARPADVFTDLTGLAAMVRTAQQKEIKEGIDRIKKEEPNDADPGSLFEGADFKPKHLDGYEVGDKGVTFHYEYGFPKVAEALQPDGAFFFSWAQLRPYIKPGGLLTRIAR